MTPIVPPENASWNSHFLPSTGCILASSRIPAHPRGSAPWGKSPNRTYSFARLVPSRGPAGRSGGTAARGDWGRDRVAGWRAAPGCPSSVRSAERRGRRAEAAQGRAAGRAALHTRRLAASPERAPGRRATLREAGSSRPTQSGRRGAGGARLGRARVYRSAGAHPAAGTTSSRVPSGALGVSGRAARRLGAGRRQHTPLGPERIRERLPAP